LRRILHISDVHFGPPHRPEIAAGVVRFAAERRPDVVVLSGDLTQRAKPAQFRQARAFVDDLAPPTIVVPGNHDVPMYRFWERLLDPYGAYRRHFDAELEPVWADEELFVVGVNTAYNWTVDNGRVVRRRLREVERLLAERAGDRCRIVVAHHHFAPPPRFGSQSVLRNARAAMDVLTEAGVELVLSGHQHQAYIASSEEFYPRRRAPLVIVHSGTTTSSRGRGGERGRNSCNWIRIDERTLTVSRLFWEPAAGRFDEHSRHTFPRIGRAGYSLAGVVGEDPLAG